VALSAIKGEETLAQLARGVPLIPTAKAPQHLLGFAPLLLLCFHLQERIAIFDFSIDGVGHGLSFGWVGRVYRKGRGFKGRIAFK